jgi:DNA primase
MNKKQKVFRLLESFLGDGAYTSEIKGEAVFYCPNCHHRKRKLCINTERYYYHCWVCEIKGINIVNLILKYGNKTTLRNYYEVVGKDSYIPDETVLDSLFEEDVKQSDDVVELPEGFKHLSEQTMDPSFISVIKYLNKRNINKKLFNIFNIGWSSDWNYTHRVIIPSYDVAGKLNYFVTRTAYDDLEEGEKKYKNCSASWSNTIPFELYVNWNKEITLVEGIFDFIKHHERNVIPLLGNNISNTLLRKFIHRDIPAYVMLDSDMRSKAIDICALLNSCGIKSYFVDVENSGFEDPGEMNKEQFIDVKNNHSAEFGFELLIENELARL